MGHVIMNNIHIYKYKNSWIIYVTYTNFVIKLAKNDAIGLLNSS